VPSFTDKLMKDSNFTSALIFLILAFVVGAALNIVSLFVPHFLLKPMRKTVFIPLILAFVSVAALSSHSFLLSIIIIALCVAVAGVVLCFNGWCPGFRKWVKERYKLWSEELFPELSFLLEDSQKVEAHKRPEITIPWRMAFAVKAMFRGMIAISIMVALLRPPNWPSDYPGDSLNLGFFSVSLLCWSLLHQEFLKQREEYLKKKPATGEQPKN
jgi:hypothetical protein